MHRDAYIKLKFHFSYISFLLKVNGQTFKENTFIIITIIIHSIYIYTDTAEYIFLNINFILKKRKVCIWSRTVPKR